MELYFWIGPPIVQDSVYPIPEEIFIPNISPPRATAMAAYPVS